MDLGDKLVLGTLLVSEGLLLFGVARLAYHTNQVKIATIKFLDTFTSYLSTRVSTPENIQGLADLAKYRAEIGI